MKLKQYLNEASFGKKMSIEREAYMKNYPEMLKWTLYPYTDDDETNYKTIENIAWKEAMLMKKKNILDFHDNDFDVFIIQGHGDRTYEANVKLRSYDLKKLKTELKKYKFRIK